MSDGTGFSKQAVVIWQLTSHQAIDALAARNNFISSLQRHAGYDPDIYAARIIFTELVANVVRHAPGPIEITLEVADSYATLTVTDTGPGFVFAPALPSNPYGDGGRGLFIVSRYAKSVSVKRVDGVGTRVAAIFFVQPASA